MERGFMCDVPSETMSNCPSVRLLFTTKKNLTEELIFFQASVFFTVELTNYDNLKEKFTYY